MSVYGHMGVGILTVTGLMILGIILGPLPVFAIVIGSILGMIVYELKQ